VLRVPIGPGFNGSANAMAISQDAQWVAVGGRSLIDGFLSQETQHGLVWSGSTALTDEMRLDLGTIYVFHLPTGKVIGLRGHAGTVLGLTFVSGSGDPVLVSAALEIQSDNNTVGKVRIWDVPGNRELSVLGNLPGSPVLPVGLAAWRTGDGLNAIRVGIGWSDTQPESNRFRIWDVATSRMLQGPGGSYPAAVCLLPGLPQRLFSGIMGEFGVWTIPPEIQQPFQQLSQKNYGQRRRTSRLRIRHS